MKKNYEALKNARKIVKARWRKYSYGDVGGYRCAIGAMMEVVSVDDCSKIHTAENHPATKYLLKAMQNLRQDLVLNNTVNIPAFNDDPKTTKEDVIQAFTNAMRMAR